MFITTQGVIEMSFRLPEEFVLCLSVLISDGLSSKQFIIYCHFSSGTKLLISLDVARLP